MKEILEFIARTIAEEPDAVSVTEIGGAHTSILELKVAKTDIGKVIGKQGRTADALRTILNAVSAKAKKRTVLEIIESSEKQAFPRGDRNDRSQDNHERASGKTERGFPDAVIN